MQLTADALQVATQEIKQALNLLSELFSIRTAFLYGVAQEVYQNEIAGQSGAFRPYCQLIQTELKHKCFACDADKFRQAAGSREPLLYRCYNGLYEMFLPLYLEGFLVGYLHFGQVRSEEDFAQIRRECRLDEHSRVEELEMHYYQMEVVPKEKLRLIAQLFKQLAAQLLHHKLIALRKARPEYYLKQYVEENLAGNISIQAAASYIDRSVSFVTHQFKQIYGCSFHEYVLNCRIEKARTYLTSKSIAETAGLCGFKNRYHFSRVFKQYTGTTPAQYQKVETDPVLPMSSLLVAQRDNQDQ
jgi:AraC-like DNA-binding protein